MFDAAALLYLYVETPLHAGIGATPGTVDLPIQRERTTQYPTIQGSSIKGVLRSLARERHLGELELIFGPDTERASAHAGAISVGDARLLLFPVRSLKDVFVYATSNDVLARYRRDLGHSAADWLQLAAPERPQVAADDTPLAWMTENGIRKQGNALVLEEFTFIPRPRQELGVLAGKLAKVLFDSQDRYWAEKLERSLVVLPDDDFRDFTLYATELVTRVCLGEETKTVARSALWTEEHLPSETVLYAPIFASAARAEGSTLSASEILERVRALLGERAGGHLQLGGDETVGRGLVHFSWQPLTPA